MIDRPAGLANDEWAGYVRIRAKNLKPPRTDTYDIDPLQKRLVLSARVAGKEPRINNLTRDVIDKMKVTEVDVNIPDSAPMVRTMGFNKRETIRQWREFEPDVSGTMTVDLPESYSFSPDWSNKFGLKDLPEHMDRSLAKDAAYERVVLRIHGKGRFSPSYGNEIEQELRLMPGQRLRVTRKETRTEYIEQSTHWKVDTWKGHLRTTYVDAVIEQAA